MTKKERLEKILKKTMTPDEFEAFSVMNLSKDVEKSKTSISDYIKQVEERFELTNGDLSTLENELNEKFEEIENEIEEKIGTSSKKGIELLDETKTRLFEEIKSIDYHLRSAITSVIGLTKKEINTIIKKIEKDIEELFWWRSLNGSNNVQAVLNVKSGGSMVASNVTGINFVGSTVTTDNNGNVTINTGGGVGGGSGYQLPTGTVNGSNQVFVFATAPNAIVVDGATLQATEQSGTVNWKGTLTVTMTVPPVNSIFGVA